MHTDKNINIYKDKDISTDQSKEGGRGGEKDLLRLLASVSSGMRGREELVNRTMLPSVVEDDEIE